MIAVNPAKTKWIRDRYRPLLGEKTDEIFNEIISHRRSTLAKKGLIGGGALGAIEYGIRRPILRKISGEK